MIPVPDVRPGRFVNIAHRGASGHAPENTVIACRRALEMGADFIELDVRRSTDGFIVAFHDATLERTTSGRGEVADHSLAELQALDAGSWFNRAYPDAADPGFGDVGIASLADIIEAVGDSAGLYIEAKSASGQPGIEADLVALLAEHGLDRSGRTVLQAFATSSLWAYRELVPQVPRVQLLEYVATDAGEVAEMRGITPSPQAVREQDFARIAAYADGVGPNFAAAGHELVDRDYVEAAHAAGLFVHVWTVNDEAVMRRLVAAGVDGIFTDHPDRLAAVRAGS